ncbi:MAG TPA: response regulator, partial [Vicinamibacterales bacterium]|nr:response regulator [Vicinamibacterales bacterium]
MLEARERPAAAVAADLAGLRVLVIDGCEAARGALHDQLAHAGLHVFTAGTGAEGLQRLREAGRGG